MRNIHIPVLQKEVLEYLDPKPNENFIDCTIDGGGHSFAILEKTGPKGKVLGIEWDSQLLEQLLISDINRLILVNDSFLNLKEIIKRKKFRPVNGILFDLGMSSWHLEASGRGFSFLRNEPLDMRYNLRNPLTAEKIINYWSGQEIERILREFGEERFAERIAKKIVEERKLKPIKNTSQLVKIIEEAMPSRQRKEKIHFATRTFQALRITVNDELDNFKKTLPQAVESLGSKGGLVVISFHSLEDRIVKNFFKEKAKEGSVKIMTKKPVVPTKKEIKINPRSRSSKLRAAEKI